MWLMSLQGTLMKTISVDTENRSLCLASSPNKLQKVLKHQAKKVKHLLEDKINWIKLNPKIMELNSSKM